VATEDAGHVPDGGIGERAECGDEQGQKRKRLKQEGACKLDVGRLVTRAAQRGG